MLKPKTTQKYGDETYCAWLLATGLLAGCHKDAETASYDLTGKYTASNTIKAANPIRMFTQAGEVSNPALVTRFLVRRPSAATYFSPTDVVNTTNASLTLRFYANNRATLTSVAGSYVDSTKTEVTDKQPQGFLLQAIDSVNILANTSSGCGSRVEEISNYIKGFYPGKRCRPMSIATGYSQYCRLRPLRVIGAHGGQLYVPYFSWLAQSGSCYQTVTEWNTFSPAVLSHLAAGDTVVVQEREVVWQK